MESISQAFLHILGESGVYSRLLRTDLLHNVAPILYIYLHLPERNLTTSICLLPLLFIPWRSVFRITDTTVWCFLVQLVWLSQH